MNYLIIYTKEMLFSSAIQFLNGGFDGEHPRADLGNVAWMADSEEAAWAGKKFCGGNFYLVLFGLPTDLEAQGNDYHFNHFNRCPFRSVL